MQYQNIQHTPDIFGEESKQEDVEAAEEEAISVPESESELEIDMESEDVPPGQGAVSTNHPLPLKPIPKTHKASAPPLPSSQRLLRDYVSRAPPSDSAPKQIVKPAGSGPSQPKSSSDPKTPSSKPKSGSEPKFSMPKEKHVSEPKSCAHKSPSQHRNLGCRNQKTAVLNLLTLI